MNDLGTYDEVISLGSDSGDDMRESHVLVPLPPCVGYGFWDGNKERRGE
jgi:hypothetical protein